ncbi:MAG: aldehyde dehydrogenase family protein, partial [Verrucomicrobiota bacterium]|nr:aldehyde dehydrogenase family protein [Verrucomicrobiota bacterium]
MKGTQLIGNTESAQGTDTFKAVNPLDGKSLEPPFHEATAAEIDSAFELAGAAAPFMAASTGEDRSRLLNAIADALEEDADVIKERV